MITRVLLVGNTSVGSTIDVVIDSDTPSNYKYMWMQSARYTDGYSEILSESNNYYTIRYGDKYIKCLVIGPDNAVYSNVLVVSSDQKSVSELGNISKSAISELPLVGNGLSYEKLISDISGSSEIVSDKERINQSIKLILSVAKGEIPMMPNTGCDLYKLLFEGITDELLSAIELEVQSVLAEQEPRIAVTSVQAVPIYESNIVNVVIDYNIVNTNIRSSYIYNAKIGGELNE